MAKVQGPCLSFSASGTLAGALVFRTTARGAQVQRPPGYQSPPSAAQLDHRADFKAAADAWRAVAPDVRQTWHAAAAIRYRAGRQLFLAEWRLQRSSADRLPLIPAANY